MAVTLGLTGTEVGAGTGDPVPEVPEGPVRLELLLPLTDTWGRGGSLSQRETGVPCLCPRAWREPEDPALLALLSGAPELSRGTKERGGREPGLPLRPRGQPLPDLLRRGRRTELGGGK